MVKTLRARNLLQSFQWTPFAVAILLVTLAGSSHANDFTLASPGECYGSTGLKDGGRLIKIDPQSGAGMLIGATGLGGMPGLAIDSQGRIYGTERTTGGLYRVDAATGQSSFLSNTGIDFLDAIAFDENDVLYGIGFTSSVYTLWVIDPQSGGATQVGPMADAMTGMAFDPMDGQLYTSTGGFGAVVDDGIYRVDKFSGVATLLGTTGFGGATSDLHFDAAGNLYGAKPGSADSNLIQIDKSSGVGALVGAIGFVSVSGLAAFHGGVIEAVIEIKGGSDPSPINVGSKGKIPVAILGSASFDVTDVDVTTLAFGPAGAAPAHRRGGHLQNANDDGFRDLVSHYNTQETGIVPGQAQACVTGEFLDVNYFSICQGMHLTDCKSQRVIPYLGSRE